MRNRDGSGWLGNTNGWWNRGQDDPLNRQISELREEAQAEKQRRRALQQNDDSKVILNDDGFRLLANALLLAWCRPGHIEDDRARRGVNTELRYLRDFLHYEGVLAPEFDRINGCNPTEFSARLDALTQSPAVFVQMEIKDITPPNGLQFPLELQHCFIKASTAELRMKIASMGRCTFTLSLRDLVIRYFAGADIWGDTDMPANTGPRAGDAVARTKKAQKVLEDTYSENPDRQITKADAIASLRKSGFTGNESKSIWQCTCAPNWKEPGKIRADVARVPLDDLQKKLAQET